MYITLYKSNQTQQQLNYDDILNTNTNNTTIQHYKLTIKIDNPNPLTTEHQQKIQTLAEYIQQAYSILEPFKENYEQQYYEFKIPKRSGGLRTINAPLPEFKQALSKVKDIFEQNLKCLSHDSAYAYTKQRSIQDALVKHKNNNSNWFLKIDLTNFFPSCTPDFIYTTLTQLYPFYYFNTQTKFWLKEIVKICCLNGGLPQGTPMSPLLTNLCMVPYDYLISDLLKRGTGEHYVYTRYADDILISSKSAFNWQQIQTLISGILRPFQINTTKTRYGSRAGRNWNLGLMLNKDNNITLGHQKKKTLNAMLNNLLKDFKNNIRWSKEDVWATQGQLSYLKHIEPEYYNYMLQKYEAKYDLDYKSVLKILLN